MQDKEYQYLYDLEKELWWFRGMKSITAALIHSVLTRQQGIKVLDAGCGTGDMMQWLSARGAEVTGLDISPTALRFCRLRGLERLVQGSVTNLPFEAGSFDGVTSFDVIVQLPDAVAAAKALEEMYRVLRPGGWVFLRAAAYPWMRSSHDVELHSHLRFTRPQLSRMAAEAGFSVGSAGYANTFLLPLAMVHRLLLQPLGITARRSDVRPLPPGLSWFGGIFRRLLEVEAWLTGKGVSFPFGLSVVMLLEKPLSEELPTRPDPEPESQ